ncbi:MAG TPA: hypothetical protein VK681_39005 [Reyranella sp.]|nr:hypothetical protein [Reyranella sp.]
MRAPSLLILLVLVACGGSDPSGPPPAPIAQVVFNGPERVKGGEPHTYSVTQILADNSVVNRPISWSVSPSIAGTITSAGVLTTSSTADLQVIATIDGVQWPLAVSSYDWVRLSSATIAGAALPADVAITNYQGTSEYPTLLVGCANGGYVVGVSFQGILTLNGDVSYQLDGGATQNETWVDEDDGLAYPSATNAGQKAFATTLAAHHLFGFAFSEYVGPTAHATEWRLTGMTAAIATSLAACASDAMISASPARQRALGNLLEAFRAGQSSRP